MNNKEEGKRLKLIRVTLDKTQEEMAQILLDSDNKATISAYENGRLEIAPKAKVILFTTLGISKVWFETGEGEMFIKPTKVTYTAGDGPKSVLGKIQAFLRAFDAPLAKWVAEKVDGPGLDEKDIDYLEDRIEQIKASIPGEISKMEEEFKLLKLKNKK